VSASQRHQQRHMVPIQLPQRTQDFLKQFVDYELAQTSSIDAACRRSQRWCGCVREDREGGVICDNSREMRPKYRKARPYLIVERHHDHERI
jgi:hypothetical protein